MWSYSRYITNVAFQTPWNERGDGFYRKFYVEILRDLEELAKAYDDGSLPNSLAVVKTWKASLTTSYCHSMVGRTEPCRYGRRNGQTYL